MEFETYYKQLNGNFLVFSFIWENIFIDESHRIKNPKAHYYFTTMALLGKSKFCLTGNLIVNSERDIHTQLRFIGLERTSIRDRNCSDYILNLDPSSNPKISKMLMEIPSLDIREECFDLLHEDYLIYLSIKIFYKISYEKFKDEYLEKSKKDSSNIMTALIRLRQACIHPGLPFVSSKRKSRRDFLKGKRENVLSSNESKNMINKEKFDEENFSKSKALSTAEIQSCEIDQSKKKKLKKLMEKDKCILSSKDDKNEYLRKIEEYIRNSNFKIISE